jgi:hypothetical protein
MGSASREAGSELITRAVSPPTARSDAGRRWPRGFDESKMDRPAATRARATGRHRTSWRPVGEWLHLT